VSHGDVAAQHYVPCTASAVVLTSDAQPHSPSASAASLQKKTAWESLLSATSKNSQQLLSW
jgi:hypothetical protein